MSAADVKDVLTKLFKEVDKDNSGQLDKNEVEAALKKFYSGPDVKNKWDDARVKKETADFFKSADKNNDSKVTLKEFIDYYVPLMTGSK
jgi:Ca2+-binding EF-hand superfamily protein